ncbi:hypothetical protein ABZ702_01410 [Streptomyces cyaneofuscatus]|uniref:hypothetical protein n=1 Tax=Streptomyces cyaneofuscatus TaxID=66883 RepID=UPI0033EA2A05
MEGLAAAVCTCCAGGPLVGARLVARAPRPENLDPDSPAIGTQAPGGTTPGTGASPTGNAAPNGYTAIFEDKPLTLCAQFTSNRISYTNVDLDQPKIDPNALSEGKGNELQYEEFGGTYTLRSLTTMGRSAGTTPQ